MRYVGRQGTWRHSKLETAGEGSGRILEAARESIDAHLDRRKGEG